VLLIALLLIIGSGLYFHVKNTGSFSLLPLSNKVATTSPAGIIFTATPASGSSPLQVTLSASIDSTIYGKGPFVINFGDGPTNHASVGLTGNIGNTIYTTEPETYTYTSAGIYTASISKGGCAPDLSLGSPKSSLQQGFCDLGPAIATATITVTNSTSTKPLSYEGCLANGGKDYYPRDYTTLKICLLNNTEYSQNCTSNNEYFIISEDPSNEGGGSNILIKKKTTANQNISCDYIVNHGDFEITGEFADYVLALENNFLILDEGTGPDPRGLVVYNLDTRTKIYQDSYSKPFDVKNNTLYYWAVTTTPVTTQNCPDSQKWEQEGLGSAIDAYVSLDLTTLTKTDLGQYRCSPRQ